LLLLCGVDDDIESLLFLVQSDSLARQFY
jgi:hypothetical protein